MPRVRAHVILLLLTISANYSYIGLGVLFGKLEQGVQENRQVLSIARMRAEAEETYGQRLGSIVPSADKLTGGFSRDDGATARKVRTSLCLA
jgi:hypothetical protein